MSTLTFYILRQMIVPFVIITLTLSGILWLLRAVKLVDIVVISGEDIGVWLELLLYTLPMVLVLVIPSAFLLAIFYSFYRLFMDNEIAAMFSIGISRMRLLRPVLLLSFLVSGLVLVIGFYAIPWSEQIFFKRSLEIDSNITNALLRPGIFTNPTKGITAYIHSRDEKGFLRGIFFQDSRDNDRPVSYTAESGALIHDKDQTELVMFNGYVQHYDRRAQNSGITMVKFDRYSYNLSQLGNLRLKRRISAQNLYPAQLYQRWHDPKTSKKEKWNIADRTHRLLLKPLYVIAYALIVLAIFLPAQVNRRGYTKRIIFALITALTMRLSIVPLVRASNYESPFLELIYAIPLIVILITLLIIGRHVGLITRLRHRWASTKVKRLTSIEVT